MALRRMWDAAWPPTSPPKWEVAAGYMGPFGATPHIWTDAEWAATGTRWRLPIFVRVPPTSHNPHDDAAKAIAWLTAHDVPAGVCMALDIETAHADDTDPKTWDPDDYIRAFDADVVAAGWKVITYGTRRTLLLTPKPSGGWWDAQWTNVPHLNAGSAATQYGGDTTLGKPYDASLVADSTPLWDMEADMTKEEFLDALREELGTIGRPSRVSLLSLMRRGVNSTVGAVDNDEWGKDSPTRKGITALVEAAAQALDPAAVAKLVAGELEITGIQTDPAGVVTVTFGPRSQP